MPLRKGKKSMKYNMHELRHGKQFAKTMRKHGKKTALSQAVAISLAQQRKK